MMNNRTGYLATALIVLLIATIALTTPAGATAEKRPAVARLISAAV